MTGKELADLCAIIAESTNLSRVERARAIGYMIEDILELVPDRVIPNASKEIIKPKKTRKNESKVIATAGSTCVCNICKKIAYSVIADVFTEGMSGEQFLKCFDPELPENIGLLTDEYGNECVDCPLCRGEKSIVLIRRDNQVR